MISAIKDQCDHYLHAIPYGEFAGADSRYVFARSPPRSFTPRLTAFYFVNSGTEAIEASSKLAKRATGRTQWSAARRSHHGRHTRPALPSDSIEPS
ncbi:MAG: hypothetical protein IPH53_21840 [Flavobacteriales bacterium]|nr:hypothetical protein [Flavobacteriales bacterium]